MLYRFRSINTKKKKKKKEGIIGNTKMAIKDFPNIGNNIQYIISGQQTLVDPQGSFIILL